MLIGNNIYEHNFIQNTSTASAVPYTINPIFSTFSTIRPMDAPLSSLIASIATG